MRWLVKALAQQAFGTLPGAENVNYLLQRHVTRSLPLGDEGFRRKATRALQHIRAFREHAAIPLEQATFYEFGAGWDLVVPLGFWSLGVERQILIDVRPNLRLELVNESLRKYERLHAELEVEAEAELRSPDGATVATAAELRERFGITYLAPRDARATGLPSSSIDLVSSTDTFEHIPADDLPLVLRECRRLLKPGGILSARIDLEDHYARSDPRISRYNYLRFSDRTWRLLSGSTSHQNRLRYPDYIRLVEDAGLDVVAERVSKPTAADLEALARVPLAPRFRSYSTDELAVRGLVVIARSPSR